MGGLEMYEQARKWQSKNGDPDMADSKFKVSHSQGSIFFPQSKAAFFNAYVLIQEKNN